MRRSFQFFRAFLCLLVCLLGGGVAALPSSATTAPHTSAQRFLSDALSAAQSAGSMHFVDKTTVNKKTTQTLEGVVSAPTAGETLNGSAPLQVELIGGSIYVIGSAAAIQQALQITAGQAEPYAQKWIVVSTNDAPFQLLAQDLTMGATFNDFTPGKSVRLGKEQKLGHDKVIPVVGRPSNLPSGTSGSTALWVSAKAPHVPLGGSLILANKSGRLRESAVFKDWGARVSLTAPTGGTPFSTVLTDN